MAARPWTRLLLCLAVLLHSRRLDFFACASDPETSGQNEAGPEKPVEGFAGSPTVAPGPEDESVLAAPTAPEIQASSFGVELLPSSPPARPEGVPDEQEEQQHAPVGGEEDAGRACAEDLPLEKTHVIAEALLKFTSDLVREVELEKSQDNLFLSPLSITLALAQLALGAANQTEKALLEVLHLEGVPCLHQALRQVRQHLDKAMLSVAARLYLQKGFRVKEKFLEDSERLYRAKAVTLTGQGEEDLAVINGWVKEATRGHIPKILSELPASVAMVLLNAVYFQGLWRTKFDPELTEPSVFYLDDEFVVPVEMMKAPKYTLSWYPLDSLDVQVARFPFKGNMSFVAIVPNQFERNISQLLIDLSRASLFSHFPKERPTMVKMPKVNLQSHLELNQALIQLDISFLAAENILSGEAASALTFLAVVCHSDLLGCCASSWARAAGAQLSSQEGLGELFSSPDFRRIAEGPLFISSIQHSAALELDETGVEAAAATSVVMSRSLSTFVLNRPFAFFILEDTMGIPLFFGNVRNPNPGAPKQTKEQEERSDKRHPALNMIPK